MKYLSLIACALLAIATTTTARAEESSKPVVTLLPGPQQPQQPPTNTAGTMPPMGGPQQPATNTMGPMKPASTATNNIGTNEFFRIKGMNGTMCATIKEEDGSLLMAADACQRSESIAFLSQRNWLYVNHQVVSLVDNKKLSTKGKFEEVPQFVFSKENKMQVAGEKNMCVVSGPSLEVGECAGMTAQSLSFEVIPF